MKLLTTSNAKKGLLLILKTFGFLFTAFFAFIDIVFGDPDEYDEKISEPPSGTVGGSSYKFSDSTAVGKPLTLKNVNNIHNEDW